MRTELGESDRRTERLPRTAGRRLGEAGIRAIKRGDMPATVSLLDRAIRLLPKEADARHELMCELGIAQYSVGDTDGSTRTFGSAIDEAVSAGRRRIELRARLEAAYARLLARPEGAAEELLAIVDEAIPLFEAVDDARSLARAWLLTGYVRGGLHGNHVAWEAAEERALAYYKRTTFPTATCLQQIAAAIYWGPTPVPQGILRCAELCAEETMGVFERASILPFLGGLHAQLGEFATARRLVDEAEYELTELGALGAVAVFCGTVRADVELLAGDLDASEATLLEQCEFFERTHNRVALAGRAAKLAETMCRQGRVDDAQHWATLSRANAASDDQSVQLLLLPVEAKLCARRGAASDARELAEEAVRLADGTDGLNLIASTRLALAEVLRAAELDDEAQRSVQEAVALFGQKGNVVGMSSARALLVREVPA